MSRQHTAAHSGSCNLPRNCCSPHHIPLRMIHFRNSQRMCHPCIDRTAHTRNPPDSCCNFLRSSCRTSGLRTHPGILGCCYIPGKSRTRHFGRCVCSCCRSGRNRNPSCCCICRGRIQCSSLPRINSRQWRGRTRPGILAQSGCVRQHTGRVLGNSSCRSPSLVLLRSRNLVSSSSLLHNARYSRSPGRSRP